MFVNSGSEVDLKGAKGVSSFTPSKSNGEDIWGAYQVIKGEQSRWHFEFLRLERYSRGELYPDIQPGSVLRDEPSLKNPSGNRKIIADLCGLTIDDLTSMGAQPPAIDVPVPDDSDEMRQLAQQNEDILYGTWEESGQIFLLDRKERWKNTYGWSVMGVLPDLDAGRMKFVVHSPQYCYPRYKLGTGQFLSELYVSWRERPAAVQKVYPNYRINTDFSPPDQQSGALYRAEFMIYWNEEIKATFCDGQLLSAVRHDYGYVPFFVFPNVYVDGTIGKSSIAGAVGLNIAMNDHLNLSFEWLRKTVRNPIVFEGTDELPDAAPFGDQGELALATEGHASRLPAVQGILPIFQQAAGLQEMAQMITGQTGRWGGESGKQYVSAGGLGASMSPGGARLDQKMRIDAEFMQLLNQCCLMGYEKHFPSKKISVYSKMGDMGKNARNFTGKEISGYYRNVVTYSPAIYADESNKFIRDLQMLNGHVLPKRDFMKRQGIINPDAALKKLDEERLHDAQIEAQAAKMMAEAQRPPMPPPDQGAGAPGSAALDQLKVAKGATDTTDQTAPGPAGAPPGPAGPGVPTAPPEPGPPPRGHTMLLPPVIDQNQLQHMATLQQVADAIRGLPNLPKDAKIYLVGQIVYHGATGGVIEVVISNPMLKATLSRALPWGKQKRLAFHPLDPGTLNQPYLDVSPGTQGYEAAGQENAIGMKGQMAGAPPMAPEDLQKMLASIQPMGQGAPMIPPPGPAVGTGVPS